MGGSSGSKGDKTSSTMTLPPEIAALAKRNLANAERAGQIGYVPYQGPTVGALNPLQVGAMQQNESAMRAFGMQPQSVASSIPTPTTYAGGIQGYDPMGLYMQSLGKIDPTQRTAIESFNDPRGVAAANAGGAAGSKGGRSSVGGPMQGLSPQMQAQSDKDWARLEGDPLYKVFTPGEKGGRA